MHRKMSVLLAGLMLTVIATLPLPNTVEAQGVLALRVATVVGVGTTQTLHLYYVNVHSDRLPAPLPPHLNPSLVVTIQPGGVLPDSAPCTQTIQAQINLNPGLNVLALEIASDEEGKKLLVNGVPQKPTLDFCFDEAKRVVFLVGEITSLEPHFPTSAGSVNDFGGGFFLYDITDHSGATAATVGLDLPQKFLIFEDRNGDIP